MREIRAHSRCCTVFPFLPIHPGLGAVQHDPLAFSAVLAVEAFNFGVGLAWLARCVLPQAFSKRLAVVLTGLGRLGRLMSSLSQL